MSTVEARNKQVPIPDEVWDQCGLHDGSKLEVQVQGRSILLVPKSISIKDLRGILPKPSRPVTLEEMEEAIGRSVMENDRL